jgi:beta-lactamase class A
VTESEDSPTVTATIEELFARAGCTGQLCVQALAGGREIAVEAGRPAVAASVFKVLLALEAETQFAAGRLDRHERVTLPAAARTPGPTGFSLFRDDVQVSRQDLVVAMLTISDNAATDALLHQVGVETVNASAARLGLTGTVIPGDLYAMINSIGRDAGFTDWAGLTAWGAQPHSPDEDDEVARRVRAADALTAGCTTRTTARDMVRLLRLIWSDQAGPPAACLRVRQIMGQQLTRHRLAAAFPSPARVSAKSGGLIGVIRNEAGVIEYPDGRAYAAAVFTQARQRHPDDAAINAVIGQAAAVAVASLAADAGSTGASGRG